MALTDRLRAAVFARDKGICAFSGLSLWILDQGTPVWNHDWPDHVKPVSRGGRDTIDNLVSASFFYNRKKLNNGADTAYLFSRGRPTEIFFKVHGEITIEVGQRLARHAALNESDWYFNRALSCLLIAISNDWASPSREIVRKAEYWRKAASTRLRKWRALVGDAGADYFLERDLVRFPSASDVQLMLSLADGRTVEEVYGPLEDHYRANADTLEEFCRAVTAAQRQAVLLKARNDPNTTEPLRELLHRNSMLLGEL